MFLQVPQHSHRGPPYPLRGQLSSSRKPQKKNMLQKVYYGSKMHFQTVDSRLLRDGSLQQRGKASPITALVQLLLAQNKSNTLKCQAQAGKS